MPVLYRQSVQRPAFLCWLAVVGCGLLLALTPAVAQLAVPALTGHVVDHSATLSAQQLQQLESRLASFEQSSGAQVVVLLVPSTQPEDIASYANRVANNWKIGRKEVGDGLLLLVAKDDHKVRIEVAKSLEGAIPDLAAKRIIDQAITPHFKQSDFAGGLTAAVDQIAARINGEALPAPASAPSRPETGFQWNDLLIFAFFAVPVIAAVARRILGSTLGALAAGGAVGAVVLFLTSSLLIAGLAGVAALVFTLITGATRGAAGSGWSSGRHGGWGGGGGGGGFGGFSSGGGGDFGGGGASGDW